MHSFCSFPSLILQMRRKNRHSFVKSATVVILHEMERVSEQHFLIGQMEMTSRIAGISRISIFTLVVLCCLLANPICASLVMFGPVTSELESERSDECERDCEEAVLIRHRTRTAKDFGWRISDPFRSQKKRRTLCPHADGNCLKWLSIRTQPLRI